MNELQKIAAQAKQASNPMAMLRGAKIGIKGAVNDLKGGWDIMRESGAGLKDSAVGAYNMGASDTMKKTVKGVGYGAGALAVGGAGKGIYDYTTNKTAKECLDMTDLQKTAMLAKEAASFGEVTALAKGYASQAGAAVQSFGNRISQDASYAGYKAKNMISNVPGAVSEMAGRAGSAMQGALPSSYNTARAFGASIPEAASITANQMAGQAGAAIHGAGQAARGYASQAGAHIMANKGAYGAGAGALAAAGAGYAGYQHYKEASEMVYGDEIQMAKQAAELMYANAMEEANEKLAFAQELFAQAEYAEKVAQDNGPALPVNYIDQVRTPAGAAIAGAIGGGAIGGIVGAMRNGAAGAAQAAAVGAGSLAGAGALIAFVDQHRMARAQQLAGQ